MDAEGNASFGDEQLWFLDMALRLEGHPPYPHPASSYAKAVFGLLQFKAESGRFGRMFFLIFLNPIWCFSEKESLRNELGKHCENRCFNSRGSLLRCCAACASIIPETIFSRYGLDSEETDLCIQQCVVRCLRTVSGHVWCHVTINVTSVCLCLQMIPQKITKIAVWLGCTWRGGLKAYESIEFWGSKFWSPFRRSVHAPEVHNCVEHNELVARRDHPGMHRDA